MLSAGCERRRALAVREDHAAAEDGDGDAELLVQLLQLHLRRPLAGPVPGDTNTMAQHVSRRCGTMDHCPRPWKEDTEHCRMLDHVSTWLTTSSGSRGESQAPRRPVLLTRAIFTNPKTCPRRRVICGGEQPRKLERHPPHRIALGAGVLGAEARADLLLCGRLRVVQPHEHAHAADEGERLAPVARAELHHLRAACASSFHFFCIPLSHD